MERENGESITCVQQRFCKYSNSDMTKNVTCYMCTCVSTRFTELYVEELENEGDLRILVSDYLKCLNPNRNVISGIIRLDFTSYCYSF